MTEERSVFMHLKDYIKAAVIIAAVICLVVFLLGKLDKTANDTMEPTIEQRSSVVDEINNT